MKKELLALLVAGMLCLVSSNVLFDESTEGTFWTTELTSASATTEQTTTNFVTTTKLPTTTEPPSGFTCKPDIDCTRAGIGGQVPDPLDCQRYYVCINSGGEPVPAMSPSSCPGGQYFNGTSGSCVAETSPGICTSACGPDVCATSCPVSPPTTTVVSDASDCSIFTICQTNGGSIPSLCPSNAPYFNGITCVASASECCSCRPRCITAGTEIQDPCDCTSYYICSAVGQPHLGNRGSCAPGTYFDENQAECLTGNCISSCSAYA